MSERMKAELGKDTIQKVLRHWDIPHGFSRVGQPGDNIWSESFFANLKKEAVHWSIENSLHWVMDVTFHEDYAKNRKDHSAANMVAMRRFALNLIKQDKTARGSIKVRRKRAGLKDDYLLVMLGSSSRFSYICPDS